MQKTFWGKVIVFALQLVGGGAQSLQSLPVWSSANWIQCREESYIFVALQFWRQDFIVQTCEYAELAKSEKKKN